MFLMILLFAYALHFTPIQGAQKISKSTIHSLYKSRPKAPNINQAISEKAFTEFLTSFDQNNTSIQYQDNFKQKLQQYLSFKDANGKPLININGMYTFEPAISKMFTFPSQPTTPLLYALDTGKTKLAQILLENGANFESIEQLHRMEIATLYKKLQSHGQKQQFLSIFKVFNALKFGYAPYTCKDCDQGSNLDVIEMLKTIQQALQQGDDTKFNELQAWIYNTLSEKDKNSRFLKLRLKQAFKEFKNGSIGRLYFIVRMVQKMEDYIKSIEQYIKDDPNDKYIFSDYKDTIQKEKTTTFKELTDTEIQQMINDLEKEDMYSLLEVMRYHNLHYHMNNLFDTNNHMTSLMYDITFAYGKFVRGNKKPLKDILFTQARVLQAITGLSSFISERALAMEKIFKKESLIPIINFLTETKGEQKIAQEYKEFFKINSLRNLDDDTWTDNPLEKLFKESQETYIAKNNTELSQKQSVNMNDVD